MQMPGRISLIIIIVALFLGATGILAMFGYTHGVGGGPMISYATDSGQFCLPAGEEDRFPTAFWGMIANRTGVDDSSAVLLLYTITGYPGKYPRMLTFSFSSKKDWWTGSQWVIMMNNDNEPCGCYAINPSNERPDVSGYAGPTPGELFTELEQVPYSDIGLSGKELSIYTAWRYDPPAYDSRKMFLLKNGSAVPIHDIAFAPQSSLSYPWSIKIEECTGDPGKESCGTSTTDPGVWVFSDQRLDGATYQTTG